MKKITKIAVVAALIVITALTLFMCYQFYIEPLPSQEEKKLAASLHSYLKNPGDWVKVSDIHPGNWEKICVIRSTSTGGTQTTDNIQKLFGIKGDKLDLVNGLKHASDWAWVVMFYYPPNTVEAFEIPTDSSLGNAQYRTSNHLPCRGTDAVFWLNEVVPDISPTGFGDNIGQPKKTIERNKVRLEIYLSTFEEIGKRK